MLTNQGWGYQHPSWRCSDKRPALPLKPFKQHQLPQRPARECTLPWELIESRHGIQQRTPMYVAGLRASGGNTQPQGMFALASCFQPTLA
jgi:hypothetical protein